MKPGYRFGDESLLELALTHRSAGRPNNERLEFLGDALVNLVVAEMLYDARPRASEGELSRLRAQLVSEPALAERARELQLGDALKLGSGELKSGGFRRDSILADAFEALAAAIHRDGGFEACRAWLREVFAKPLAAVGAPQKDPKTLLQEWLQGRGLPLPRYELLAKHGEEHARRFDVACAIDQPRAARFEGSGGSRRAAEQQAAEAMLGFLVDSEHHE
ncbi:MAG: Ribonuclease III [Rhodanobacteraceae bacterium]|nr:MAG: Ribonuclease III [Rhodanobacteraceae bacterium]